LITLQDCIAMCDLDEAEVLAIAEHEHIPEIAAAALQYLPARAHGAETRTCCAMTFVPRLAGMIATMRAFNGAPAFPVDTPRDLASKAVAQYLKTPEAPFGGLPFSATA